ncbi:AraC family ligand binding domain-containing protein [Streptomyces sp. KL116D]|uniref:AraC family ligand binding domain-containing protein n=1 Tax=Streptomyces sp. KL116D TaxID=3045152 RepID=UPI0035576C71
MGLSRRVHRIDFHVLLFFREGPVHHMIDFAEYEVGAGDVLWIRARCTASRRRSSTWARR